jgi:hypothetical protein
VSALLELEPAFERAPWRTPTPPRLALVPPMTDENATVVEAFRVHYAGLLGSPDFVRVVERGTRVNVVDVDGAAGLCRVQIEDFDESTALVELAHCELDVRQEGYLERDDRRD